MNPAPAEAPLRVLAIGNSFAHDATRHLPGIARAAGRRVRLLVAGVSGASFETHLELAARSAADPAFRPYAAQPDPLTGSPRDYTLAEALAALPWDIVTIQQASTLSHEAASYEPHATRLIELIRRHAPAAEIVVHQTWAYRDDAPLFADGALTPALMHARLAANYASLAARHGLRLLPVGDAFRAALATPRWAFRPGLDPGFDYANPPFRAMPRPCGGLHMGWSWIVNAEGREVFWHDYLHANDAGRYLAACVWHLALFDQAAVPAAFVPPGLAPADAADLHRHAVETVARPIPSLP